MNPIYLDHASTTPVDPAVLKAMQPYYNKIYANPSSIHAAGQEAKEAVEEARKKVAEILHCLPEEIIFTSGGTESINLALKGIALPKKKGHIITSQIEHPAVLETCRYLERKGYKVTYLSVDKFGLISPAEVKKALRSETILISIMYANNEIGTIEPILEIGKLAQQYKIPFHTDACQAGLLELDVEKIKVDMMTLNGSKIYGPKGIGILYKKNNMLLDPLHHGGGQEFGVRSGTENVPAIIGFAAALELVQKEKTKENKRVQQLRDYFIVEVLTKISDSFLSGHPTKRLSGNAHFSFAGVEAEAVVRHLSQKGIYASTGSACSSTEIEVSHVLKAVKSAHALGGVRFSFGKETSKEELKYVVKVVKDVVESLRKVH
ncbi:MAG: cysteine desulfurase family protein [Nanoarchaeota archaeon]|nr:cysteine desulfurase family protein [Nanoarchaeota archaeon]